MAFKARFDSDQNCPKCKLSIVQGELVQYADSDRKVLEHYDCEATDELLAEGVFVRWESVTEESLDRLDRLVLEEAQVAPLGPQGKCHRCNIELPKTRVCGYC